MTDYYLDTSVAGRIVLGHSPEAAAWFDSTTGSDEDSVVSSRICRTELTRLLRREGLGVSERDQVLAYIAIVPLDTSILVEAEAIVPHIKTLDAIHLASAMRVEVDGLTIVSHDDRMKEVAAVLGFSVYDPVV